MKFSQESLSRGVEKKKRISEEKMSEEAVFVQKEGAAHIGPEFNDISHDIINEDINKKEENSNYRHKSRVEKFFGKNLVDYTSKFRHLIDKRASGTETKKEDRSVTNRYTGDNLKTMPESKKERNKRGEIREVLHDPKNWDEAGKKFDPMDFIGE